MLVVLIGIILYAFLKARRERLGQAATPAGNLTVTSGEAAGGSPSGQPS